MKVTNLLRIKQALTLLKECPPSIKEVLRAGDTAINASGLNPWCCNEGLAEGHEKVRVDIGDLLDELDAEILKSQAEELANNPIDL